MTLLEAPPLRSEKDWGKAPVRTGGWSYSKGNPTYPCFAYPRHPLSPPNDSGIPKHKLLGQGGWGMLQGSVGKFLEVRNTQTIMYGLFTFIFV